MAQLHINDFPDDFITAMDDWGKGQMPPLNRRQVVMKIVSDWIETIREEPKDKKQAQIAELRKRLMELEQE